ncbi:nucleotide-diphospho-sugar transferase [Tanacetum coccineum]
MAALDGAGGWQDSTTVEDMDLAVRATLIGWKLLYLGSIKVKSELPTHIDTFILYCVVLPMAMMVPEVAIPKWGMVLIPIIITLLNAVGTPRSFYLVVIWILFKNVMSLHQTKATFIGLFETGKVNEWVVTEKLEKASKGTSKPLIKHRFRISERYTS